MIFLARNLNSEGIFQWPRLMTPEGIHISLKPFEHQGSTEELGFIQFFKSFQKLPDLSIFNPVPSGKQTVCELENGPVEIVDFPIENGDFL